MSAGARFAANLQGTFSGADYAPKFHPRGASAPLFEIAAAHDRQPPLDWLRAFLDKWRVFLK